MSAGTNGSWTLRRVRTAVAAAAAVACLVACADDPAPAGAVDHDLAAPARSASSTSLVVGEVVRIEWVDGDAVVQAVDPSDVLRAVPGPLRTATQSLLCTVHEPGVPRNAVPLLLDPDLGDDTVCGPADARQDTTARSRLTRSACLEIDPLGGPERRNFVASITGGAYPGQLSFQSPQHTSDLVVRESITVGEREYRFSQGVIELPESDTPEHLYVLVHMPYGFVQRNYVLFLYESDECPRPSLEYPDSP